MTKEEIFERKKKDILEILEQFRNEIESCPDIDWLEMKIKQFIEIFSAEIDAISSVDEYLRLQHKIIGSN